MAADVQKALISSLQSALTEVTVFGETDLELKIAVHVGKDDSTPSFIDLVKRGSIKINHFGVVVSDKVEATSCEKCSKDVNSNNKELEFSVCVIDTLCQSCSGDTSEIKTETNIEEESHSEVNEGSPEKSQKDTNKQASSVKQVSPVKQVPHAVSGKVDLSRIYPKVILKRIDDNPNVSTLTNIVTASESNNTDRSTPVKNTIAIQQSKGKYKKKKVEKPHQPEGLAFDYKDDVVDSPLTVTFSPARTEDEHKPDSTSSSCIRRSSRKSRAIPKRLLDFEDFPSTPKTKVSKPEVVFKGSTQKASKQKPTENVEKVSDVKIVRDLNPKDEFVVLENDFDEDDEDADPDFNMEETQESDHNDHDKEDTVKIVTVPDNGLDDDDQVESTPKRKKRKIDDSRIETISDGNEDGIIRLTLQNVMKEEFPCSVCWKSFTLKRCLYRHVKKEGEEAVYCDICNAKFHNEEEVKQHKLVHTGENKYLCTICHKSFNEIGKANKHIKYHLAPHDRPFICTTCGKGFIALSSLREHTRIHSAVKPYMCAQCPSAFAARFQLKAHMKYHSSKPYTCYTCRKTYKIFGSLQQHLYVNKDHYSEDTQEPVLDADIPYLPVQKPPKPTAEEDLNKKKKKKLGIEKDILNLVATLDKTKTKKKDQEHDEIAGDTNVNSSAMEDVVKENSNENESTEVEAEPVEVKEELDVDMSELLTRKDDDLKHGCKICFRKYGKVESLTKHYKKVGTVAYACGKCEAKFHSKEEKSQHNLHHTGVHPYQCKVCFHSFKTLSKCAKHTSIHISSKQLPHKCDQCNKSYAYEGQLVKHKIVHDEHNELRCDKCDLTFQTPGSLRLHMDVHMGRVYKCDTCQKEYKYPSSLSAHLKYFKTHTSSDFTPKQKTFKAPETPKPKEPEVVICEICGVLFGGKVALASHMRSHQLVTPKSEVISPEELRRFSLQKHKERIEKQKTKTRTNSNKKREFTCEFCGHVFLAQCSLRRHKALKHDMAKYRCKVCPKKFYVPSELERHEISHFAEKTFFCSRCPSSYYHEYALKRHMKIHIAKETQAHVCQYCGKCFTEACYLREHIRRHTGETPFKCDVCGKGFTTKSILKGHKLSHGPKNFKCEVCGKCFAFGSNLNKHVLLHQEDRVPETHLCEECGKSFSSKSWLKNHMTKHTGEKRFVCSHPGCTSAFFYQNALNSHMKTHEVTDPIMCDLCGKLFKHRHSLRAHMRVHISKPNVCEICNKAYYHPSKFRKHMIHHLGERNLKCDMCDSCFITPDGLRSHKLMHTDAFKCDECDKVFHQENKLKSHKLIHEGDDKVKCPRCNVFYKDMHYLQTKHLKTCDRGKKCLHCDRKFVNERTFQGHLGYHSGKRPHMCEECGIAYQTLDQLLKHQQRHSKPRYPCKLCDKRFDRANTLRNHEQVHRKKEMERRKIEAYKAKLNRMKFPSPVSVVCNVHPHEVVIPSTSVSSVSTSQSPQDLLAQAAASLNMDARTTHVVESGTVVQYVQPNGQVIELDTSSIVNNSSEQVILTTIDSSQLSACSVQNVQDGGDVLMVAMIPEGSHLQS